MRLQFTLNFHEKVGAYLPTGRITLCIFTDIFGEVDIAASLLFTIILIKRLKALFINKLFTVIVSRLNIIGHATKVIIDLI